MTTAGKRKLLINALVRSPPDDVVLAESVETDGVDSRQPAASEPGFGFSRIADVPDTVDPVPVIAVVAEPAFRRPLRTADIVKFTFRRFVEPSKFCGLSACSRGDTLAGVACT